MSRFIDMYLSSKIVGYPVISSPRFSTDIVIVDSGAEQVNQHWQHPLHRYVVPEAVRDMEILNTVRKHWLITKGPANIWPFRDPLDFASVDIVEHPALPTITAFDQIIGNADNVTNKFQLVKEYSVVGNIATERYTRTIKLPVVDSVKLAVNGIEVLSGWSIERGTGIITFDIPPVSGLITAGYFFDVPVRFENDNSFEGVVKAYTVGQVSDLVLLETRFC